MPLPCRSPSTASLLSADEVRRKFFQMFRVERPVIVHLISEGIPQNWLNKAGDTFAASYLTSLHDFSTKTGFLCLFGVASEVKLPSQAAQLIVMLIASCYLIYLWYRRLRTQMTSDLGLWYLCPLPAPGDCCLLLSPVWTVSSPVGTPRVSFCFREVLAVRKLIENIFK